MHLVLHYEFLKEHFKRHGKPLLGEIDFIRKNIVDNPKNKFVMSNQYLEYIDKTLQGTEIHELFTTFYVENFDTKFEIINTLPSSIDIDQEYYNLTQNCSHDFFLSITEGSIVGIANSVCMTSIAKANHHWVLGKIAAMDATVSVNYSDFRSNTEIQNLFDNIFLYVKPRSNVYYFDSYAENLSFHNYFQNLCRKMLNINVYMYGIRPRVGRLSPRELSSKAIFIRARFSHPCDVSYTCDNTLIHERTIMFNHLIINNNDDFGMTKITNPRWTVYFSFSDNDFQTQLNKIGRFIPISR